jgi:hypothetical protein
VSAGTDTTFTRDTGDFTAREGANALHLTLTGGSADMWLLGRRPDRPGRPSTGVGVLKEGAGSASIGAQSKLIEWTMEFRGRKGSTHHTYRATAVTCGDAAHPQQVTSMDVTEGKNTYVFTARGPLMPEDAPKTEAEWAAYLDTLRLPPQASDTPGSSR